MTQRGLAPETVEIVVESDVHGHREGSSASIRVRGARVVLRVPAAAGTSGAPAAAAAAAVSSPVAGSSVARVEVLWLTPAETDVLESGGAIDATHGLGAALVPLLIRLGGADGARGQGAAAGDRQRVAIMARGLLSAVAAELVIREESDSTPQQRLAVLAMQIMHSQLENPELTSRSIAQSLGFSLRTLQVAFRSANISPTDMIRALRVERAGLPPVGVLPSVVPGNRRGSRRG